MKIEEMIEILKSAECDDPFECPFGMFGRNEKGQYGCFAKYPNGNPEEKNHGCIAQQAAEMLEQLKKKEDIK